MIRRRGTAGRLCGLVLAGLAATGPVRAQGVGTPAGTTNPSAANPASRASQSPPNDDPASTLSPQRDPSGEQPLGQLPGLPRTIQSLPSLPGIDPARPAPATPSLAVPSGAGGTAASDGAPVASVSRLAPFRSGGRLVSRLPGTRLGAATSLLRDSAAPARRLGSATRRVTQETTRNLTTDLRLAPLIQSPVSGLPLPTTVPLLGFQDPASLLLGPALRRPFPADEAYAPLGIKLGSFLFLPAFTQSIGYDTNPDQITARAARSSVALRSEAELAFRSDWSSSEFAGELRGSYLEFPENDVASRPSAAGATRFRADINRDTRFDFETRFVVDTQRAGSPDLAGLTSASNTARPLYATYGATAGVTESFNRFQLTLRGSVDRQSFQDARLPDGTVLIQSDRDANQYGLRLRAGYEISPVLTPFVETLIDTRVYDTPVDQSGVRRDSDGIAFSLGTSVQLTRVLSGEVSAGIQHRSYVDPSLRAISAPLVNAALIWSLSPLTTIRLNQQTGILETAVPGSGGVVTEAATLEVQHDLLRNLSITLGGAFLRNDYEGVTIRETGFSALARVDYRFNRWLALRGSYIYQRLDSTAIGSSFSGNSFLVGLRVNP